MNCKKCGNIVDPNSKFCNACGEPVENNSINNGQLINNNGVSVNKATVDVNSVNAAPVNNEVSPSPIVSNDGTVNPGVINNVNANVTNDSNVSFGAPNNNESNLVGTNVSMNSNMGNTMVQPNPTINNIPNNPTIEQNNVNNQMPNNINPTVNQNAVVQNQTVQPKTTKKSNTLNIIIIVLAIVVIIVAGIIFVNSIIKDSSNKPSGNTNQAKTSSSTSTTSTTASTTAKPVSSQVSHYGYNFILPRGFEVSNNVIIEGLYTLQNRQKKTFFCYNLFNDSYSDVPSLVAESKAKYEEEGAIVIANENEKNGIKYYLLEVTINNVNVLEYIIDFKGEGIFLAYAYNIENYGKDNYTNTMIEFVSNARYGSGTFAKGGFSSDNKPHGKFDVVMPE